MTKGKRVGYIRVSTVDQNPARQLDGIELDRTFTDHASGTSTNRPELANMLSYVREDDTIIVHSMDRLARNCKDLRHLIDELVAKGVQVQFLKENLTFNSDKSAISNLMLYIMGAVAEFEHAIIHERLMQGIRKAQKEGRMRGRRKSMNLEKIALMNELLKTRKSKTKIASELGICTMTLYKYIKEEEGKTKEAK